MVGMWQIWKWVPLFCSTVTTIPVTICCCSGVRDSDSTVIRQRVVWLECRGRDAYILTTLVAFLLQMYAFMSNLVQVHSAVCIVLCLLQWDLVFIGIILHGLFYNERTTKYKFSQIIFFSMKYSSLERSIS